MKSYLTIDEFDNKFWRNENNELHRENGPAIEWVDGNKWYYINNRPLTPEQFKKHILKKRLKELI